MRRPSKYYAELYASFATKEFVAKLAKENALSRFHEITRLINVSIDRASGSESLCVTTAVALSATALKSLKKAAEEAGFIDVETRVDPAIIGGSVIRTVDRRIDLSVAGALRRLYESLTRQ